MNQVQWANGGRKKARDIKGQDGNGESASETGGEHRGRGGLGGGWLRGDGNRRRLKVGGLFLL